MVADKKNGPNRYINDLRRFQYYVEQVKGQRSNLLPIAVSMLFLALIAVVVASFFSLTNQNLFLLVVAAVVGGYMALNIGANDVANNMGPAVGGKVLSVGMAVVLAAICESTGALLAGGDVVSTVSKGIIDPEGSVNTFQFCYLMLSALFSAALWINLATYLNAPVSTTHSIVGGVLGAGIAAAGVGIVNWKMVASIVASWFISPVCGALIAALMLYFIKTKVFNVPDRILAARKWVPFLMGLMAAAFTGYMLLKGLKRIWPLSGAETLLYSITAFILVWVVSSPYIKKKTLNLVDTKKNIYTLFHVPLIAGVCLLSFAHGANDVANAVGPLAAIVSAVFSDGAVAAKVSIPLWVMGIGAVGIALGLMLFGPKLITTVGQKITRLNAPRAYCVALSSAITVLIATNLGLPVSSTHIAIGAIFGVGFLREFLENPNKKKLRPGHKLNHTADEAFRNIGIRSKRKLIRRQFMASIGLAWVVTVPASAVLAAIIFVFIQITLSI